MILITGAYGFIGSRVATHFSSKNHSLILVDDWSKTQKEYTQRQIQNCVRVERSQLFDYLNNFCPKISAIIHLGARTDTTLFDESIFEKLNIAFSKAIWHYATAHDIPLVYASSAATYGDGAHGYSDESPIEELIPLNPYGMSKHVFDLWNAAESKHPSKWYGLKFFNVYGYGEHHKGRMASVIFHLYHQLKTADSINLFRSHKEDIKDGEQLRDFIYVEDIVSIIDFLLHSHAPSGLYNCGTGKARTFNDLAKAVFECVKKEPKINYIDIPIDIRNTYQYRTEATMSKLQKAGYHKKMTSLEEGIALYLNVINN